MAIRLFESKAHASLYQKYMVREGDMVKSLIFSYLEEKKGRPFGLAVDVGCGTGASTRFLGPHFQKVIGVDISEAQIQEARRVDPVHNVSYMLAAAEHLPVDDGSVDLITASVAAHWFNLEEFLREVDRVLQPRGCLALYTVDVKFNLHYKSCSERLTGSFMEAVTFLLKEHGHERVELMQSQYKEIFDGISYADKTRITDIQVKQKMSIAALVGLIESSFMFQKFLKIDEETAKEFLQSFEERLLIIMGTSSSDAEVEFCTYYACVLACKPAL